MKDELPQKAMSNLASYMEVKKPSTISDVKTKSILYSDNIEISVTVTKTITQAQLAALVK